MPAIRRRLTEIARALRLLRTQRLFDGNYLRSLGFNVRTIIDIGVYTGTKPLYDAFDDCFFILVDPLLNIESLLHHRPKRYNFVNKLLGGSG